MMYRATADCIAFVERLGHKLREVVPAYQQSIIGDRFTSELPNQKAFRDHLASFIEINARFNGRFPNGKPNPKGHDLRLTLQEANRLIWFARYLLDLGNQVEARKHGTHIFGEPFAPNVDDLIIRERILG